jgi:uncharacterized protein YdaU (DUF1376 family)
MSNNLYMPWHPGDYLTDTAHLSTVEHGAYCLLIMNYWQRGEPLPADDRKLRGITRMTPAEWADSREVLLEFFTEQDGLLHHKRIDAELARAMEKSENARALAKRSHSVRKANAERRQSETLALQEQVQEQVQEQKEEATASSLAAAAEPLPLREVERRCEQATGYQLPGIRVIEKLIAKGHDLEGRILPLLRETAASRKRIEQGPPESWAYFTPIIEDAGRSAKPVNVPATTQTIKVFRESALWPACAKAWEAEKGKPPPVSDGYWFFPPHMVPDMGVAA